LSHKDLRYLTSPELLWLERLRRGETQEEAARRRGVTRNRQCREEAPHAVHAAHRYELSPPEQLRLARRRSGLQLEDLASRMGVSKVTILKYEAGAGQPLLRFWRGRGFTFALACTTSQSSR
jgi:DNA-binding XRE family transcriptional regulator